MKPATPTDESVFETAQSLQPDAREAFLAQIYGDNQPQLKRMRAMLRAHDHPVLTSSPLPEALAAEELFASTETEVIGASIGPYKLVEQIGEGGMGVVYVAEQTEPIRRRVALKIIKPGMDSRQVIARFEAERQALAMMDHPRIARVFDGGATDQGRPYFVMELVKGIPITTYCQGAKVELAERLKLLVSVCQAVQHAHQKGIIHRDIKPSNVLVTMLDGRAIVKVIDFGIAKVIQPSLQETAIQTGFSQMVGTPLYMSPEQAALSAVDVDTRSDVYSLGVLLYELLTGTTPFENDTLVKSGWDEMRRIIREVEPPRPSQRISTLKDQAESTIAQANRVDNRRAQRELRGELDWIVMRALEKDRARRYQSPAELADDLERYLSGAPVAACPPTVVYRLRKYARRHAAALATTAFVALTLILGTGISIWQAVDARAARGLAENRLDSEKKALSEEKKARAAEKMANDEAAKARLAADADNAVTKAVKTFLRDELLGLADPSAQIVQGDEPDKDIKLRTVLDRAAKRLEGRYADQPLIEASLRQTIGDTYLSLQERRAAQPHLVRALELYRRELGDKRRETLEVMRAVGYEMYGDRKYKEAEALLVPCLDNCQREFGERDRLTLEVMKNVASLYRQQKRFDEAKKLYVRCLDLCREVFGEEGVLTLDATKSLALLYAHQGDKTQAEKLLLMCWEINQRKYGEEHSLTVQSLQLVADNYANRRDNKKAEALYQKLLDIRRRVVGEDNPKTLYLLQQLGLIHHGQGNLSKAESFLELSFEVSQRKYGDEAEDTLLAMELLADLCADYGKSNKAEVLFKKCLEIRLRVFGEENSRSLLVLSKLGMFFKQEGRFAESEPLLTRNYEVRQRLHGENNAETLTAMNYLAMLYDHGGKPHLAEELFLKCLQLRTKLLGEKHPETLRIMNNLAQHYESAGRNAMAQPLLLKCVAIARTQSGNAQSLMYLNNLADNHSKLREFAQAEQLFAECLDLRQRLKGLEHHDTLLTMVYFAKHYVRSDQLPKAKQLLSECVERRRTAFGIEHLETLKAQAELCYVYEQLGNAAVADSLQKHCLETYLCVYGEEHAATLAFIMYLARSYHKREKFAESEELFLQHLDVMRRKYGEDHLETLVTKNNLAVLYMDYGPLVRAERLLQECINVYRRDPKIADQEGATTKLYNLGSVYLKRREFAKAEAVYSEVLAAYRRTVGNDHADTVDVMRVLGRIYDEKGESSKAEPMLRAFLDSPAGKENRNLIFLDAQSRLGGVLLAQGKLSEAEPLLLASYEGLHSLSQKISRESQDLPVKFLELLVKFYQTKPAAAEAARWQVTLDAARAANLPLSPQPLEAAPIP